MSKYSDVEIRRVLKELLSMHDSDGYIGNHEPIASNEMILYLSEKGLIKSFGTTGTEGEHCRIPRRVTAEGVDAISSTYAPKWRKAKDNIIANIWTIVASVVAAVLVSYVLNRIGLE